ELAPVGGAELFVEAAIVGGDRVEDRGPVKLERSARLGVGGDVGADPTESPRRIFFGWDWLAGSEVSDAMHDVGTAELHAELERSKLRRCAVAVGDALIGRNPVGEAGARHAVVANLIAWLQVLPGEPGHAALVRIARA